MTILAIDPGPAQSAFVIWDGQALLRKDICANESLRDMLDNTGRYITYPPSLVIEMIGHYGSGMPAGKEVFETCHLDWPVYRVLAGAEARAHPASYDQDASMWLRTGQGCEDVRQALIDRSYGAPGVKKAPGVLYGVTSHCWAALALAVCAHDRRVTFNGTVL